MQQIIKYVNGIPIIPTSSEELPLPSTPGIIHIVEDNPFLNNVVQVDPSQVTE